MKQGGGRGVIQFPLTFGKPGADHCIFSKLNGYSGRQPWICISSHHSTWSHSMGSHHGWDGSGPCSHSKCPNHLTRCFLFEMSVFFPLAHWITHLSWFFFPNSCAVIPKQGYNPSPFASFQALKSIPFLNWDSLNVTLAPMLKCLGPALTKWWCLYLTLLKVQSQSQTTGSSITWIFSMRLCCSSKTVTGWEKQLEGKR